MDGPYSLTSELRGSFLLQLYNRQTWDHEEVTNVDCGNRIVEM
jgi:hypothetical protein